MNQQPVSDAPDRHRHQLLLTAQATVGGGDPHVAFRRPSEEYVDDVLPPANALWSAPDVWRAGLDVEERTLARFFDQVEVRQSSRREFLDVNSGVSHLQLWALIEDGEVGRLLVEWQQSPFVHSGHGDSKEVFARAWLDVSPAQLVGIRLYIDEQWPIVCAIRTREREQTAKTMAWDRFLAFRGLDAGSLDPAVEETLREHDLDPVTVEKKRTAALRKAGLTNRQIALKSGRVLRDARLDQRSRRARLDQARKDFEAQYEPEPKP